MFVELISSNRNAQTMRPVLISRIELLPCAAAQHGIVYSIHSIKPNNQHKHAHEREKKPHTLLMRGGGHKIVQFNNHKIQKNVRTHETCMHSVCMLTPRFACRLKRTERLGDPSTWSVCCMLLFMFQFVNRLCESHTEHKERINCIQYFMCVCMNVCCVFSPPSLLCAIVWVTAASLT